MPLSYDHFQHQQYPDVLKLTYGVISAQWLNTKTARGEADRHGERQAGKGRQARGKADRHRERQAGKGRQARGEADRGADLWLG